MWYTFLSMLEGSFFYRLSCGIADGIVRAAHGSLIVRWMSQPNRPLSDGFFFGSRRELLRKRTQNARQRFAALVEDSMLVQKGRESAQRMLSIDLSSYGAGLLAFGACMILPHLYRLSRGESFPLVYNTCFAMGCAVNGIVCLPSRQPLGEALSESKLVGWLLFDVLAIQNDSRSVQKTTHSYIVPVITGVLCGILTLYLPLLYMLAIPVGVACLVLLFCQPEIGVMLLLCVLPFMRTIPLALLCLLVCGTYLFRLAISKQTLRVDAMDLSVFAFSLVQIILGGVTSIRSGASIRQVFVWTAFIAAYLPAANALRDGRSVSRMVNCLVASAFAASLVGIYQNRVGLESSVTWIDTKMFSEIGSRVIGPFDNPNVFGAYLILLMPLAIHCLLAHRGASRLFAFMGTGCIGLALIYTWSRGAWLGALLSLIMFAILYRAATLRLTLPGLALLPFAVGVLPASILNRILSIGNLADTSTAYRVSIWTASVRMLHDVIWCGVGTGSEAFTALYPVYALSGAAYALHAHNLFLQIFLELGILGIVAFVVVITCYYRFVFGTYATMQDRRVASTVLALSMGVLALLTQGLTDHVWFNYRIVALFWIILGLTVGISRAGGSTAAETTGN